MIDEATIARLCALCRMCDDAYAKPYSPVFKEFADAARTALPALMDEREADKRHAGEDAEAIRDLTALCDAKDAEIARLRAALAEARKTMRCDHA